MYDREDNVVLVADVESARGFAPLDGDVGTDVTSKPHIMISAHWR